MHDPQSSGSTTAGLLNSCELGQGTLNGFLANMARQARTAEDFRDMAGAHWAPKVAGLVCAAHFLAHRLRLPPPSLLVVEAAAGAATRSKMQGLMLCFGLSAWGARNQGLLGLGSGAGCRCGSQIALEPLAAGGAADSLGLFVVSVRAQGSGSEAVMRCRADSWHRVTSPASGG